MRPLVSSWSQPIDRIASASAAYGTALAAAVLAADNGVRTIESNSFVSAVAGQVFLSAATWLVVSRRKWALRPRTRRRR